MEDTKKGNRIFVRKPLGRKATWKTEELGKGEDKVVPVLDKVPHYEDLSCA
jgi:hypothetical protein